MDQDSEFKNVGEEWRDALVNEIDKRKIALKKELYYATVIELAHKFRMEVSDQHVKEFIAYLRRFILEYYEDNLGELEAIIYREFKKLFKAWDEGKIMQYSLPKVTHYVSEQNCRNLSAKAAEFEKGES